MPPTAIDTETTLSTALEYVPRLVSMAVPGLLLHRTDPRIPDLVRKILRGGAVFANAPFDVAVLIKAFPDLKPDFMNAFERGAIFDVITRSKLIAGQTGHRTGATRFNLGALAERTGYPEPVDKDDPWRLRYGELINTPIDDWPPEARAYAQRDADATQHVFLAQQKHRALLRSQAVHVRAHWVLYQQTIRGIRVDPDRVVEVEARLQARLTELNSLLLAADLIDPKKGSLRVKRAQQIIEETAQGGIERTPTGKPRLTEDALARLEGLPAEIYALIERKALSTKLSKNIASLKAAAELGCIRTRYDEVKVTGRTGARKDSPDVPSDNLQNQPRKGGFRECLVPRPGYRFVIADWSGAELVTLAYAQLKLSGRSRLADALRAGVNPHDIQAARLLGIDLADFDKRIPEHNAMRQLAKALNFGFPADMGAARFVTWARVAYGLHLTEYEARQHKKVWQATWPEIILYQRWCTSKKVDVGKYEVDLSKFGVPMKRVCGYCDACNFPFQGIAAYAAKKTLWELYRKLQWTDAHMVLFVHDENVVEVPEGKAEQYGRGIARIMKEEFEKVTPGVPIEVDWSVKDRYSK